MTAGAGGWFCTPAEFHNFYDAKREGGRGGARFSWGERVRGRFTWRWLPEALLGSDTRRRPLWAASMLSLEISYTTFDELPCGLSELVAFFYNQHRALHRLSAH